MNPDNHTEAPAAAVTVPATPPPLAAFDPAGTASVISYQVPEPTSYIGRHLLTLNYGLGDFATVTPSTAPPAANSADAPHASLTAQPVASTQALSVAATTPRPLVDSLVLPGSVVASDSSNPTTPVIAMAPFDLSARLGTLTWADVTLVAAAGKRVEVYRSISGQLDFRVRDNPTSLSGPSPNGGSTGTVVPQMIARPQALPVGRPIQEPPDPVTLTVVIDSPTAASGVQSGPWNGLSLTVSGQAISDEAGTPSVTLSLINAAGANVASAAASVKGGSWQGALTITASGQYTIQATGHATSNGVRVINRSVPITVALAPPPVNAPPPPPPAIAPSVVITSPSTNTVITQAAGNAIVHVTGTVDTHGGSPATVSVSIDGGAVSTVPVTPPATGTATQFTTTVAALGFGPHTITVTAVNADGIAAPAASVPISVLASQPVVPLDRRLYLIEKLAITSFLGNFGASRVVKTFSLLPGEQTTISVDSYTKEESTAKTASSILDSSASESAADFEDTVNDENDQKTSNQDQTNLSVSADVGANWGWGHADIKAGYSDQANASRENTVKTVTNALQKHTSKASTNRSVSVNTDFSSSTSSGTTTDTTRTLSNINVSRVLNCVFRQLTQEHQVVISLIDATVGYYAQDELVDAAGNPVTGPDGGPVTQETFTEYTLPELAAFAQTNMTGPAIEDLPDDLLTLLGGIPDYQGTQQSLIETVTPKSSDGTAQTQGTYLRVRPNLTQTYTDVSGAKFTVPGIILGQNTYVLRTDQLVCDALLGQGNALDGYSQDLQDVTIAERQAATAATMAATAREQLAQQIITNKDADAAAVWQKIYPQPLSVPATVTLPMAVNGNGSSAGTDEPAVA